MPQAYYFIGSGVQCHPVVIIPTFRVVCARPPPTPSAPPMIMMMVMKMYIKMKMMKFDDDDDAAAGEHEIVINKTQTVSGQVSELHHHPLRVSMAAAAKNLCPGAQSFRVQRPIV